MRVAFVIDSLIPGGTERSVADLATGLRDVGVTPSVVQLFERGGHSEALRAAGVNVLTLGSGSRPGRVLELRSVLRSIQPDVVHTQLFEADIVGRIAGRTGGIPVVSSLVNLAYGVEQHRSPGIRARRLAAAQAADLATARLVRRFHAVSEVVARTMGHRLRIPAARIEVVPRGRSRQTLGRRSSKRSLDVRSSLGIERAQPLLLAVGRQEWQKGFDVLMEALQSAPPPGDRTVVLLVGREGNATAALRTLAAGVDRARWDLRCLGPRDDVDDLMVAADAVVSPSRWEGLPGTLIEALALEVPIIATDIEPIREVVGGLPGVALVESASATALAAAIRTVLLATPDTTGHRVRFDERYELGAVSLAMRSFYARALG